MLKNSARILMFHDESNDAELFRAKFSFVARCKEGDLQLLNVPKLTCMHSTYKNWYPI